MTLFLSVLRQYYKMVLFCLILSWARHNLSTGVLRNCLRSKDAEFLGRSVLGHQGLLFNFSYLFKVSRRPDALCMLSKLPELINFQVSSTLLVYTNTYATIFN